MADNQWKQLPVIGDDYGQRMASAKFRTTTSYSRRSRVTSSKLNYKSMPSGMRVASLKVHSGGSSGYSSYGSSSSSSTTWRRFMRSRPATVDCGTGFCQDTKGREPLAEIDPGIVPHVLINRLRKENIGSTIEKGGLPPAARRRGLVASENYSIYNHDGKTYKVTQSSPGGEQFRSLPNSITEEAVEPSPRQATSAPSQKTRVHRVPRQERVAPLPKVNTLVNGQLTQEDERGHRNRDSSNARGHAGLPTKHQKEQPEENQKFATALANARTKNITVSGDPPEKHQKQPEKTEEKENDKPNNEQKPGEQRDKPPASDFSWRPKPADREDSVAATPKEEPAEERQAKKQKTILKKEQKHKAKKAPEPAKEEEQKPKHVQRTRTTTFVLPPRRERTRAKLQRTLTQQQLKRSASNLKTRAKGEPDEKYTIEDAVVVYASDFLRAKSKTNLDGKGEDDAQKGNEKEKTIYDSPIDPMRTVPPWHRTEYTLSKRETHKYKEIHRVYGHEDKRVKTREEQFYQKLQDIQVERWRQKHREYYNRQMEAMKRKHQQQKQLKHVRGKFEKEQVHRFRTQYVTSRILAHEWSDRYVYGLPEDIGDEPQSRARLRSTVVRPKETFDTEEQRKKNEQRYKSLFKIHHNPYTAYRHRRMKPPKMEGIDTVELEDDHKRGNRKVNVKDVVDDARRALDSGSDQETSDDDDMSSPRYNFPARRRRSRSPHKAASDEEGPPAKTRQHPPGGITGRAAPRQKSKQKQADTKSKPKKDLSPYFKKSSLPFKPRTAWDFRSSKPEPDNARSKGEGESKGKPPAKSKPIPTPKDATPSDNTSKESGTKPSDSSDARRKPSNKHSLKPSDKPSDEENQKGKPAQDPKRPEPKDGKGNGSSGAPAHSSPGKAGSQGKPATKPTQGEGDTDKERPSLSAYKDPESGNQRDPFSRKPKGSDETQHPTGDKPPSDTAPKTGKPSDDSKEPPPRKPSTGRPLSADSSSVDKHPSSRPVSGDERSPSKPPQAEKPSSASSNDKPNSHKPSTTDKSPSAMPPTGDESPPAKPSSADKPSATDKPGAANPPASSIPDKSQSPKDKDKIAPYSKPKDKPNSTPPKNQQSKPASRKETPPKLEPKPPSQPKDKARPQRVSKEKTPDSLKNKPPKKSTPPEKKTPPQKPKVKKTPDKEQPGKKPDQSPEKKPKPSKGSPSTPEKKQKPKKPKSPKPEPIKPLIPEDKDRPDIPSPELDDSDSDEDIFEKAKRKYGIVLDSDDEK